MFMAPDIKDKIQLSVTCKKKVIGNTGLSIDFYICLENQRNSTVISAEYI